jgi:K+-sensing histidine kinase KdpD
MKAALGELTQGLEQVAWVGRWLANEQVVAASDGDVAHACQAAARQIDDLEVQVEIVDGSPLRARGGATLAQVLGVLLHNTRQHARKAGARLRAWAEGDQVAVEVHDGGPPIHPELAKTAFTVGGQSELKGRADGRYGRVAGLLAAWVLTQAIGGTLEAGERDGTATFTIRAQAA